MSQQHYFTTSAFARRTYGGDHRALEYSYSLTAHRLEGANVRKKKTAYKGHAFDSRVFTAHTHTHTSLSTQQQQPLPVERFAQTFRRVIKSNIRTPWVLISTAQKQTGELRQLEETRNERNERNAKAE